MIPYCSNYVNHTPRMAQSKSEDPEFLYPNDMRDFLTLKKELVFKGQLLVAPTCLQKELIAVVHGSHIDIEGCIRRARDTPYWPRMSTELREYISKCDICMAHRTGQAKKPLLRHEAVARPWSKVSVDLCELDNRTPLVISDYYCDFIEVARLNTVTSRSTDSRNWHQSGSTPHGTSLQDPSACRWYPTTAPIFYRRGYARNNGQQIAAAILLQPAYETSTAHRKRRDCAHETTRVEKWER